jgi:hypothetical protein
MTLGNRIDKRRQRRFIKYQVCPIRKARVRIGLPGTTLSVAELASRKMEQVDLDATKHADCVAPLLSAIERQSVCRP